MVLAMIAVVVNACLFIPLRGCMLWVPLAWGCLSLIFVALVAGSPFPDSSLLLVSLFIFLSIVSYMGAMRNEVHARKDQQKSCYSLIGRAEAIPS